MITVKDAVLNYLIGLDILSVTRDTSKDLTLNLLTELNLDSLDVIELSVHLENVFDITIDDNQDFRFSSTLGELITWISSHYGLE